MAEENATLEFLAPAEFEWDEDKNAANLAKHGIDFDDAIGIFYGPIVVRQSNRNNEERWIAIGTSDDRLMTVIYTRRNDVIRIISARHPRQNEKRAHRDASVGRPA